MAAAMTIKAVYSNTYGANRFRAIYWRRRALGQCTFCRKETSKWACLRCRVAYIEKRKERECLRHQS